MQKHSSNEIGQLYTDGLLSPRLRAGRLAPAWVHWQHQPSADPHVRNIARIASKFVTPSQDFEPPSGKIKEGIEQEWGSLDDFIAKFNPTTAAVQVCFPSWHSHDYDAYLVHQQLKRRSLTGGRRPLAAWRVDRDTAVAYARCWPG